MRRKAAESIVIGGPELPSRTATRPERALRARQARQAAARREREARRFNPVYQESFQTPADSERSARRSALAESELALPAQSPDGVSDGDTARLGWHSELSESLQRIARADGPDVSARKDVSAAEGETSSDDTTRKRNRRRRPARK